MDILIIIFNYKTLELYQLGVILMEIKMDNVNSKNYYDEVLGVISNYKKLIKNPHQKINGLTRQATILTGISLVFLVVFSILYLMNRSYSLYLIVVIIFAVAFVLGIIYYLLINRRVNSFKNVSSDRKLIIENDYVELIVGEEKSRLEMSDVQYFIINKYSVCFIPRTENSKLIAVNIAYKDSILSAIDDKSIIVDNSSLY